ncbi:MAG TPA: PQQ-binding-like beta-propeller repeat protein [Bryobacteraceae bacterium]|nr:PQQ-binding-like beta-propeller repeat protein [Bryobacteraceae bacterium]
MRIVPAVCLFIALAGSAVWSASSHSGHSASTLDPGATHYSPLAQINAKNVKRLSRAWTFHTGEKGRQFETTPLLASGLLYFTSQSTQVIALQPETGKEVWRFNPHATRERENRGVSYWPGDGNRPPRVLLATGDGKLYALDAKTGALETGFGDNGVVNLKTGITEAFPRAAYSITSPPAIYRNLVIVAPSTQEGPSYGPSGDPRAFDVITGKQVWRFHTVPQPGEPGNETWGPDGWKDRSGPSLWGRITVDTERGLVFLPIGNPADSFYGADRKGTDLYANCVVALDAATGKLRWYYQMVHHDIFDYDVTGAPALVEATENGKKVPAIAEITKMGFLFILDRTTGKPVFGVEERKVPPSDVPGEDAWPTQPFPIKPPPLARISINRNELSKRSPETQKYCEAVFDKYVHGDVFTPFGLKPTLVFPGAMGGGNWGGVSFDPKLNYVFVNISNMGGLGHIVKSSAGAPMPYRNETAYARFLDQDQYPCQQPPWGELVAVNTRTGDIAWRSNLGTYDELETPEYRNAGTPNVGGSIATAGGLVFIGATNDSRFRAFDSRTGKQLWVTRLDATANSTPVTYEGRDGKQYMVVPAGGPDHLRNVGDTSNNTSDSLIAFTLGDGSAAESTVVSQARPAAPHERAAAVPATDALPEGEGKEAVVKVCSQCHGVGTFSRSRMSGQEWRQVVTEMVQRGATGTSDEMRAVVSYLSKYMSDSPSAGAAPAASRKR